MIAKILMASSAGIALTLGLIHLVFTFWGPKFLPRDPALQARMKEVALVISTETTMWRCWIGFNASHSMGVILFSVLYGFLALAHGDLLFQSPFLLAVGLITLIGYVLLAKRYWFGVPFIGISVATVCYVVGILVSQV